MTECRRGRSCTKIERARASDREGERNREAERERGRKRERKKEREKVNGANAAASEGCCPPKSSGISCT